MNSIIFALYHFIYVDNFCPLPLYSSRCWNLWILSCFTYYLIDKFRWNLIDFLNIIPTFKIKLYLHDVKNNKISTINKIYIGKWRVRAWVCIGYVALRTKDFDAQRTSPSRSDARFSWMPFPSYRLIRPCTDSARRSSNSHTTDENYNTLNRAYWKQIFIDYRF